MAFICRDWPADQVGSPNTTPSIQWNVILRQSMRISHARARVRNLSLTVGSRALSLHVSHFVQLLRTFSGEMEACDLMWVPCGGRDERTVPL
jgi:hypothetical protein